MGHYTCHLSTHCTRVRMRANRAKRMRVCSLIYERSMSKLHTTDHPKLQGLFIFTYSACVCERAG
jgi:hypothetical protein